MGYFVQENVRLWDRLFLTGGVRLEENNFFGENVGLSVNPRFSVSSMLDPTRGWTLKLRAAAGRAIRAPQDQSSAYLVLNPDLRPETNTGWEFGADQFFLGGALQLQITYFDQRSKDLIFTVPVPQPSGPYKSKLVNLGAISNKGWEFAVSYEDPERMSVGASYSRLYNKLEDLIYPGFDGGNYLQKGQPLEGAAKDAGSVFVGYHITEDLAAFVNAYYLGERRTSERIVSLSPSSGSISYLPAFVKINAKIYCHLSHHVGTFLGIRNLFNSKVDEIVNIPGQQQSVILGFKLTLE